MKTSHCKVLSFTLSFPCSGTREREPKDFKTASFVSKYPFFYKQTKFDFVFKSIVRAEPTLGIGNREINLDDYY